MTIQTIDGHVVITSDCQFCQLRSGNTIITNAQQITIIFRDQNVSIRSNIDSFSTWCSQTIDFGCTVCNQIDCLT